MKKYDIPVRTFTDIRSSNLVIKMTDKMYDTLQGALLGDGSLQIPQNGVNATFRYTSKSRQHVEFITKDFMEYSCSNGLHEKDRFDKRTNKYYHKIDYCSRSSKTFTDEYHRWYINGVKHIPVDLVLTPHMCLCWYVGDGCLRNNNNNNTQELILCTNSFELKEIENILLPQLSQFEAKPYYVNTSDSGKKNYVIGIYKKKNIKKFLDYIGPCPFDDYKHKWNIKPRLLSGLQAKYNQYASEWIEEYKKGNAPKEISAHYNCDEKIIIKTLENHWII